MKRHMNILVVSRREEQGTAMKQMKAAQLVVVFGMVLILMSCGQTSDGRRLGSRTGDPGRDFAAPTVFQAAGPNVASIQSSVDQYRAALGATNNGNAPGPLTSGRREINWDGGGSTATAIVGTPFTGFLANSRRPLHHTGDGFVQAPLAGLADTFDNATYDDHFPAVQPPAAL